MTSLKTLLAALALSAALAPAAYAQATQNQANGDLTLTFPELKATTGQVMIAVYDSAQGWASGKPVRAALAPASAPTATLAALPPGTYAVRAFQDVDGDGKMGKNPFGIPTEPFGFSKDAPVMMGPPSFEAAAFEVKAGANAQTIHLH